MKLFTAKNLSILAIAVFLLAPGLSNAEISFQPAAPSQDSVNSFINNLPQPLSDFVKSAKDISSSLNTQIGRYVGTAPVKIPTDITQLNQTDAVNWLQNILQTGFLSGIYSAVVKIIQLVGNIVVWALGFAADLVKQGLSLIHQ